MNALKNYKARYKEQSTWFADVPSKYEWAASEIFGLCTYDGGLDERFVKDILEVCKVIIDKRNYEYIADDNNYIKYILVCQLLRGFEWIDWGTSIRGAWFYKHSNPECGSTDILKDLKWSEWDFETKRHEPKKIEAVPFSVENLKALIEFLED